MPNASDADTVIAVLSGGRSRRMGGVAKAGLPLAGKTVLEHILTTAANLDLPAFLVGAHPDLPEDPGLTSLHEATGLHLVRDRHPDAGPLAGLDAAFAATTSTHVLLLACDLPFLTPPFLAWLLQQSGLEGSAVPMDKEGRLHPLCAVYHRRCMTDLAAALTSGQLRFQDFVHRIGARRLLPETWVDFDPEGRLLMNLNEPADYEAARRWFDKQMQSTSGGGLVSRARSCRSP